MKCPKQNDVAKLSKAYRVLAGFILFCSVVAAGGLLFALITEPFHSAAIIGGVVLLVILHISGSILFRGYAPKYLLFTHGPK